MLATNTTSPAGVVSGLNSILLIMLKFKRLIIPLYYEWKKACCEATIKTLWLTICISK
jgi:hypothetical protein